MNIQDMGAFRWHPEERNSVLRLMKEWPGVPASAIAYHSELDEIAAMRGYKAIEDFVFRTRRAWRQIESEAAKADPANPYDMRTFVRLPFTATDLAIERAREAKTISHAQVGRPFERRVAKPKLTHEGDHMICRVAGERITLPAVACLMEADEG